MTESESKLFDSLMQHNSAYYGYELCKGEIKIILQAFEELKQYRAIGTVSEFQQLKEKATAKKPKLDGYYTDTGLFECPSCGRIQKILYQGFHCKECGQKLMWD